MADNDDQFIPFELLQARDAVARFELARQEQAERVAQMEREIAEARTLAKASGLPVDVALERLRREREAVPRKDGDDAVDVRKMSPQEYQRYRTEKYGSSG